MEDSSTSEKVSFSTILDPDIDQSEEIINHYDPLEDDNDDDGKEKIIDVGYPVVNFLSPLEKASYTGNSISLQADIKPEEPEIFEKFFKFAFVCYNIDIATVHACFPVFNNGTEPLVAGLGNGMHTIEAALSHPSNGDLLISSSIGTKMFFIAGNANEAAAFTVDINIRGRLYNVPVMHGGSIIAQTYAFCLGIGLRDNSSCINMVYDLLLSVSKQTGFQLE